MRPLGMAATLSILLVGGVASAEAPDAPRTTTDDHASLSAVRTARRFVPPPPSEVTANGKREPLREAVRRALFASDDLPDAITPRPRRDLPRRAFSHDRTVTASRLQAR